MSTNVERLRGNLKQLGLHAIADLFEREAQKATKTKQSYVGFLDHLIDEELARKADRSVNARIIRGRFPAVKTLESFQFAFQPSIPAPLIRELAELGFLARAENLVLVGAPGTGKSHLGIAIGIRACSAHKAGAVSLRRRAPRRARRGDRRSHVGRALGDARSRGALDP